MRRARPVALVAALVVGALALASLVPSIDLNPFDAERRDRSGPVLLRSLERLSEFRAVTANLQVPVVIEDDTVLPSFLAGKKTVILAAGTVEAGVDFRGLDERNLRVSDDRRSVVVTLPPARLARARVDLERTQVVDTDRGIGNRIAEAFADDADSERELLALAQGKLDAAAAADPNILRAAERNTQTTLEGLLSGLGFERVTVRFGAAPAV